VVFRDGINLACSRSSVAAIKHKQDLLRGMNLHLVKDGFECEGPRLVILFARINKSKFILFKATMPKIVDQKQ
jgi:hypothetical protein